MTVFVENIKNIREEFLDIAAILDERRTRLWCAARAKAYNRMHGHGGVMAVHKATGVSRPRIYAGLAELEGHPPMAKERIRRAGGGRKKHLTRLQRCLKR